jgi:hypothetical protein
MRQRKPRIADEDYLSDDDLIMGGVEGEWVRTPAYKQGHKVSRDGSTAICGRPLIVSHEHWEAFRSAYEHIFGEALLPYFIALDKRKGEKCSPCKGKDMFDLVDPMAETLTPEPDVPHFTEHVVTNADRLQTARFRSKVAYVQREFGATTVS